MAAIRRVRSRVTMQNTIRIPNYCGERNAEDIKARCVALFAAVTVEKDPAKRLALIMQRDGLRWELLRLQSDAAKTAHRGRLSAALDAADSPCYVRDESKASHADTASEIPWYCRALGSDDNKSSKLPIDNFARNCNATAVKHQLERTDLLGDALANFAEDGRDYSALASTEKARIDKRWNRALSKAVHGLYARDFVEHHSREREKLGDAYQKWTPRFTRELAIVLSL